YRSPFAMQMSSIQVGVEIGSLLSDTIIVDQINIQEPELTLEGTLNGNNLGKILDNLKGANAPSPSDQGNRPAEAAGEKKSKKFIVKDIVLAGAKLHVNVSAL